MKIINRKQNNDLVIDSNNILFLIKQKVSNSIVNHADLNTKYKHVPVLQAYTTKI